ncbi:MAG: acetylxylan esterase [Clostridiales bacterium]|nr:acetylxylan esterase [Clostridiales bacterium]
MQGQKLVYSPVSLWKNFDSTSLPFEQEVVAIEENDGIVYTHLYFNGVQHEDGISRVYGVFAAKKNKKDLPAIVIVSDVGKGINQHEISFWAKKGYAVFGFDNMGKNDQSEHFTKYPDSISYANYLSAGRHFTHCDTNAKETCWYHWAANTRRAISFVCSQECVDKESVGLLATKDSAVTACMAAAFDNRLAACAIVFGVCYHEIEMYHGQTLEEVERAEERERWFAGIAPQSYLMHMQTPFFLTIGANSAQTDLDKTHEALNLIPKQTPWAIWIAEKLLDAGGESFVKNLDKWLTMRLKKQIDESLLPVSCFRKINGKLNVIVRVPDDEEVQEVQIFCAHEAVKNSVRYWSKLQLSNVADGIYRAEVDVYDKTKSCYAYSNVRYRGGLVLSTNLIEVDSEYLKDVKESQKTKIIYNSAMGASVFQVYAPFKKADSHDYEEKKLEMVAGPCDIRGLGGHDFATFALNGAKFIKGEDCVLTFDVYSKTEQELTVGVVVNYGDDQMIYVTTEKLVGGEIWQKICLSLDEFKCERAKSLVGWDSCQVLCLHADESIAINNVVFS